MILLIPNRLWHPDQYWSSEHALLVDENLSQIKELPLKTAEHDYPFQIIEGDLIPGFINAHCHLELSHMYGKIPQKTGMKGFVEAINQLRNASEASMELTAIETADYNMWEAGVVAVGDISNDERSLTTKRKSKIYYHTFLELFGWNEDRHSLLLSNAKKWRDDFKVSGNASIVPHAPYSVPPTLFALLKQECITDKIWTIHHAESDAEIELFKTRSGDLANFLKFLKVELSQESFHHATSPTEYLLQEWPSDKNSVWVHNTRMQEHDLNVAQERLGKLLYLCTCPNANLYIEDKLPDYKMWIRNGAQICIGTDSLASNHSLSIWDEIKTLLKKTEIPLETLLTWGTINGAKALGVDNLMGSFETGKQPGILLIDANENIQRLF